MKPRLWELLDHFFTEVPSTFITAAKVKLVPQAIKLIKELTKLPDREVVIAPGFLFT